MTRIVEFPNPQRRAIDIVTEVALSKNCRPFLVGGPVRDLLLGRHVIDVDLTIEEGSSTLARALAKRIEGRVRSYPQFLTYKVIAEGYPEIDIATARKERYRSPGSLPTVTAGKLKDDLLRRDFSINAMALDLINGSIHDPADGQRDLTSRLVRVLHDQSFVDDPTRIFRAIRLGKRLGFSIEARTAELMRDAVASGALATVSRERLWRELFLAMDEREAPKILAALHKEGVLTPLFGKETPAPDGESLDKVRRQFDASSSLDRYVLYTGVLLRGSDATAADLEGSGFSQKRARSVLQIARDLVALRKGAERSGFRSPAVPALQDRFAGIAHTRRRRPAGCAHAHLAVPGVPAIQAPAARKRPRGSGRPARRAGSGAHPRSGVHRGDHGGPGTLFCARSGHQVS